MAKKQKAPAKKPAKKPVEQQVEGPIILTDDKGQEHEFELIQLFAAGKANFALMHPLAGKEGDLLIQKLALTKSGAIEGFEDPSDAEFEEAMSELEAQASEAGECECDCDCCQEPHEPAPKKGGKKAKAEEAPLIVLQDDEGTDHEFTLEELFRVGKKNFAVLRPVEEDGTRTILKFTLDKKGELEGFEPTTDAEFKVAVKDLEARHAADTECECECDCCQEMHEPAPKKAAKKTSKKVSAKTAAAKKPAKKAAAKPAAKKAAAKKPAAKKAATKKAKR